MEHGLGNRRSIHLSYEGRFSFVTLNLANIRDLIKDKKQ